MSRVMLGNNKNFLSSLETLVGVLKVAKIRLVGSQKHPQLAATRLWQGAFAGVCRFYSCKTHIYSEILGGWAG